MWRSGAVAQWRSGAVAQWRSGAVAQWRSGAVAQGLEHFSIQRIRVRIVRCRVDLWAGLLTFSAPGQSAICMSTWIEPEVHTCA